MIAASITDCLVWLLSLPQLQHTIGIIQISSTINHHRYRRKPSSFTRSRAASSQLVIISSHLATVGDAESLSSLGSARTLSGAMLFPLFTSSRSQECCTYWLSKRWCFAAKGNLKREFYNILARAVQALAVILSGHYSHSSGEFQYKTLTEPGSHIAAMPLGASSVPSELQNPLSCTF
jgi:hypothetical protein